MELFGVFGNLRELYAARGEPNFLVHVENYLEAMYILDVDHQNIPGCSKSGKIKFLRF